jgi:hypothetical protein
MRKALKDIAAGGEASIDEHPMISNIEVLEHAKEAFDKWSEPTDESALSEKERKNRGCC